MLSVGQQSLLGYLPALIIQNILDKRIEIAGVLPQYYVMHTVSLFADISGFTKLSEAFSKKGRIGPEFLAFSLNRYMEQLSKNGGDIFKFAGDAILVIWPETVGNDLTTSCRRAVQCALDIQSKLNDVEISPDKKLSVKIGIGVGECRILVVGGQFKRCEYLSVGEALRQACESETKATCGGLTICSEDVKGYVDKYFAMEEVVADVANNHHGHEPGDGMKFYKITKYTADKLVTKSEAYLMRTRFRLEQVRQKFSDLKTFVPAAISLYLALEKESWSKEIRMLSIMFVNLKVDLSQTKNEEGIKRIQSIVKDVQRSIYRTRGGLNKFLMDDKGSVMVICWGFPPMSCNDDHVRSVLSALTLIEELKKHKCGAFIGVTTGTCFTGVCGTIGNRREYSVLGEVVNLSARFMGEAIKFSKDNKLDSMVFIDEVTKNLIQNKIRCQYMTSNNLKGFSGFFPFYTPVDDINFIFSYKDPFPYIRTHRNNSKLIRSSPDDRNDETFYLNKSLVMAGRKPIKIKMIMILEGVYLERKNELVVIRGVTGSGKSLFVRKSLYDFLWKHKILLEYNVNNTNILSIAQNFQNSGKKKINFSFNDEAKLKNLKPYFIFTSFQSPLKHNKLMNGFSKILQEIYYFLLCFEKDSITNNPKSLKKFQLENNKEVLCDVIGEILFKTNSITHIKLIECILKTDLGCHYSLPKNYSLNFEECVTGDKFFDRIKCDSKAESLICKFFSDLVQLYFKTMNRYFRGGNNVKLQVPLIFIIEDTHSIDDLSIRFIKTLRDLESTKDFNSFCMILTYQDQLLPIMKSPSDKICKSTDLINDDIIIMERDGIDKMNDAADLNPIGPKTFLMENILDYNELKELIRKHISDRILEEFKTNLNSIDDDLLRIIISKSFKGVPLFVLDIIDNLINSKKYVQVLAGELIVTSELIDMEQMLDWSDFTVPMRMEKIVGSLIDALPTKEIILLKYAAVIGNMFDLQKLNELNPFNNITKDELYSILLSLEEKGILEFLYDLNQKELVCKFSIPFFREILYQRMLIEQKTEIHLVLARSMQYDKFKYMPHDKEVRILKNHLKNSEKTLISQMEDDIYEVMKKDKGMIHLELMMEKLKQNALNLNNLKIFSIKNICERLKCIDMKVDVQADKLTDYHGSPNYLETNMNQNNTDSVQRVTNKENQKIVQSLISGYIEKMSEKSSLSWESRFVVVTNTKCLYFYHEKEFLENKMPLGSFLLENLYNVVILKDHQIGGKRNIFSLNLTSWQKKDVQKGHRKFFFSAKNREELYEWIITLNFMIVKATYDKFSSQYGQLRLPLRYQNQKRLIHKKIKEKFVGPLSISERNLSKEAAMRNTNRLYNNIVRKSGANDKYFNSISNPSKLGSPNVRRTTLGQFAKQVSFSNSLLEGVSDFGEMKDKVSQTKEKMQEIFKLSIIFLGYIQEVIFNADNVGFGENKTIAIPEFLKLLRIDYDSDAEEYMPQRNMNFLDSLVSEHRNMEHKRLTDCSEEKLDTQENIYNYFPKFQQSNKAITFNLESLAVKENTVKESIERNNTKIYAEEKTLHKRNPSEQSPKSQITFSNKKEINRISKKIESKPIHLVDDDDDNLCLSSKSNNSREMSFENKNEKHLLSPTTEHDGYVSNEDYLSVDHSKENIRFRKKNKYLSHKSTDKTKVPKMKKTSSQESKDNHNNLPVKKKTGVFRLDSENSLVESCDNEENREATEMSPFVDDEPTSYRIPEINKFANHSGVLEAEKNYNSKSKETQSHNQKEFNKIVNGEQKKNVSEFPQKVPVEIFKNMKNEKFFNISNKEENYKNSNSEDNFSLSFHDNEMANKELTQNLLNSKFEKNLINSKILQSLILSKEQNSKLSTIEQNNSGAKIEENLIDSKTDPKNSQEKIKKDDKLQKENPKQDISRYFKPIQLGIRNIKKEDKLKPNGTRKEEMNEYEEPLDPSNIGKIKELIRQKSKKKKKFINNINFFLFNTINSNNDIVEKINKINLAYEDKGEDDIMSEISNKSPINPIENKKDQIEEINNDEKTIKKNSLNSLYQQPKYDYLEKENSDHIYTNVHVSNIFRELFSKSKDNSQP